MREDRKSNAVGTRTECAAEDHKFEVIYNGIAPLGTVDVIRWCSVCGALRIDIESINGAKTRKSILRIPRLTKFIFRKTKLRHIINKLLDLFL